MGGFLQAAVPDPDERMSPCRAPGGHRTGELRVGAPLGFRRLVVRAGSTGRGEVVGGFAAALRTGLEDVPFPQPHHRPVRAVLDEHDRRAGASASSRKRS